MHIRDTERTNNDHGVSNIRFYIMSHEHIHTLVHTCETRGMPKKIQFSSVNVIHY